MTITDGSRHQLHQSLDLAIGEENAAVLMEHLPPVGWADVATRRDLDHQSLMINKDLELLGANLRTEMADLKLRMEQLFSRLLLQLLATMVGLFTLFFALSRVL